MLRAALFFLASLAGPAFAACDGPSFYDRFTAEEQAAIDAAVSEVPFNDGLLFDAVRGEDHLTIVGTIHIFDPSLEALAERLLEDIAAADLLLVEATQEDAAALQAHMAANPEMMFLTDGPTLPELLDEADWERIVEAARARQIPVMLAAKMQPWFLSLSLAIAPCAMPDMMAGNQGLDFLLMDTARMTGTPMRSLEPWNHVIDLMREGTIDEQVEMLKIGLLPADLQSEMFVAMMDVYLAGRPAEVWEASRIALRYIPGLDQSRGLELFAEAEDLLLVQRNANWMRVIADATEDHDRVVIAVGAAHLPYDFGVLQRLVDDGWTVTARD